MRRKVSNASEAICASEEDKTSPVSKMLPPWYHVTSHSLNFTLWLCCHHSVSIQLVSMALIWDSQQRKDKKLFYVVTERNYSIT